MLVMQTLENLHISALIHWCLKLSKVFLFTACRSEETLGLVCISVISSLRTTLFIFNGSRCLDSRMMYQIGYLVDKWPDLHGRSNQTASLSSSFIWMADKILTLSSMIFSALLRCNSIKAGEEKRKRKKKNERRFFHSFPAKLPDSCCLHSAAADLKFVTSCGQNWFPARIPFEQRGPLWRTSCPRLSDRTGKKAAAGWLKAALRRSYLEDFFFFF